MSQQPRQRSSRGLLCLAVLGLLAARCASGTAATPGGPVVTVPPDQRDLVGLWHDAAGRELPDGTNASGGVLVLAAGSGSSTCTGDHVTVFLELAWPPGRRLDWNAGYDEDDTRRYMRETEGSLIETVGRSDLDAALPRGARSTGFSKDGNTLYVIASKPSAVWVERPDRRVERWSQIKSGGGCA
ncbi:hypothetical protein SAMN04488543_1958 [Friedmanniella luteola]|uniref:Uncharacterized protein n=1 Tax=Friedmanniella luteola TaxID=546871 RepID=A0A1H1T6Q4_9ACTN|nr:hypothetical protein [Friedmanniella luteola]SDS55925.1 hypothetical protein SAMN04488543_1958 [Friedmanniella luteola]